jgi:hypothetical protein
MSLSYIRGYYKVPAERGGRVQYQTREGIKIGTITGASQYVHVRFDGTTHAVPIHPTDPGLKYIQEVDT